MSEYIRPASFIWIDGNTAEIECCNYNATIQSGNIWQCPLCNRKWKFVQTNSLKEVRLPEIEG